MAQAVAVPIAPTRRTSHLFGNSSRVDSQDDLACLCTDAQPWTAPSNLPTDSGGQVRDTNESRSRTAADEPVHPTVSRETRARAFGGTAGQPGCSTGGTLGPAPTYPDRSQS